MKIKRANGDLVDLSVDYTEQIMQELSDTQVNMEIMQMDLMQQISDLQVDVEILKIGGMI